MYVINVCVFSCVKHGSVIQFIFLNMCDVVLFDCGSLSSSLILLPSFEMCEI